MRPAIDPIMTMADEERERWKIAREKCEIEGGEGEK